MQHEENTSLAPKRPPAIDKNPIIPNMTPIHPIVIRVDPFAICSPL
jgi:hypothetical protein